MEHLDITTAILFNNSSGSGQSNNVTSHASIKGFNKERFLSIITISDLNGHVMFPLCSVGGLTIWCILNNFVSKRLLVVLMPISLPIPFAIPYFETKMNFFQVPVSLFLMDIILKLADTLFYIICAICPHF